LRALDSTSLVAIGAIPQATVAAVNIATGVKQSASTDDQGSYSFAVLSVGQHEIDVAADGFKPGRAQGLTININTALTVDVTPQVSEQNETVTVTETGALERDLRDARWRCSGFCNRSRATRSSDTGKGTREKHFLLRSF
jgi:hypothetical protein